MKCVMVQVYDTTNNRNFVNPLQFPLSEFAVKLQNLAKKYDFDI